MYCWLGGVSSRSSGAVEEKSAWYGEPVGETSGDVVKPEEGCH